MDVRPCSQQSVHRTPSSPVNVHFCNLLDAASAQLVLVCNLYCSNFWVVRDYTFSQQVAQHPCHMPTHPGDISLHREERLVPPHHKDPKNTTVSFTVSKTSMQGAQESEGCQAFWLVQTQTRWSSFFPSFNGLNTFLYRAAFGWRTLCGSMTLQLCNHSGIHVVFCLSCSSVFYKDCH